MPTAKPHIFALLAFLVLFGLIVSPVCAAEYSQTNIPLYNKSIVEFQQVTNIEHDASATNQKIAMIEFTVASGSQLDFTLYYGNGSTVTGYSENHKILDALLVSQTSATVSLGGVTKEYTYIDTQPFYDYNLAGYAKSNNESAITGFMVYSLNYGGLDNDLAAFYPVDHISQNTIYKITASSNKPFDMWVTDADPADVAGGASKNILDVAWEWINYAISIASFVLGFCIGLFWFIKFFFIDNLLLVIALYISITMAYAAIVSGGNIFIFYRRFFGLQSMMIRFIAEMWNYLIQIISAFRSIFKL